MLVMPADIIVMPVNIIVMPASELFDHLEL